MLSHKLANFNQFLYHHIPAVQFMQLQLLSCDHQIIRATASAEPNLNDKGTIFGGSSSALMTVCGWSLLTLNLQQRHHFNDVVIANAHTRWHRAQRDDLIITAQSDTNWTSIIEALTENRQPKIKVHCQVHNSQQQTCAEMDADFVVLR